MTLVRTRLLSHTDVERLVQDQRAFDQEELLLLCTVMEPVQVVDAVVKRRSHLDWLEFRTGWHALTGQQRLYIAPLDIDCLNRALFERAGPNDVTGLWPPVHGQGLPPDRTVRRLILRPSDETWWEDELYGAMEAWYKDPADG